MLRHVKYVTQQGAFVVTEDYKVENQLGYGAFGVVCSGTHTPTNTRVAMKQVTLNATTISAIRLLREIKLLRFFDHENIVKLHDILQLPGRDFSKYYFTLDLMDTDLDNILRSSQPVELEHVRHFMYYILRGLKCIHSAGVVHRDLKPKNILLTKDCTVKICDFGLAREMTDQYFSLYVETRWYRAPEIIMDWLHYDQKVDMWSVGCILAELLLRKPLWPGSNSKDQMDRILQTLGTPNMNDVEGVGTPQAQQYVTKGQVKGNFDEVFAAFDPQATDLLRKLLAFDPRKRIDVYMAIAHPFFDDIREDDEPVCSCQFDLEMDANLNNSWDDLQMVRSLLWDEMLSFHPEMRDFDKLMAEQLQQQLQQQQQQLEHLQQAAQQSTQPNQTSACATPNSAVVMEE
eukprot:TRINITY_DN67792_c1_g14_i1.p1 TRINITY_DN67792_c1_g14~~TRINITY_DN67792_c1_g14_i1.p1  ORF type:complete len:402 (-),score=51.17 TRINITY_DN67792_c1_g14_i1:202-1407(-)